MNPANDADQEHWGEIYTSVRTAGKWNDVVAWELQCVIT
jgi:hypothetical protein